MMKQTDMNPKTRHYINLAWLAGALLLTGAPARPTSPTRTDRP